MKISTIQEDITILRVDAIVNCANNALTGGSGVNGAIQDAAGPELLNHCASLGGCDTGKAILTPGFNLNAKYIIHTVGPVWHGGGHGEAVLLADCYKSCIDIAAGNDDISQIAFPAISTGVFGYPLEEAVNIAVLSVSEYVESKGIEVFFVCFDEHMKGLYLKYLERPCS